MKTMFNYCPLCCGCKDVEETGKTLDEFIQALGLDGMELLIYKNEAYPKSYEKQTVGVHLRYWPQWLSLKEGDAETIEKQFADEKKAKEYFGADDYDGWLECIRENIRLALAEKPEYLVWHVAECSEEEAVSFTFKHTDEEVVLATAEVFNQVADIIPDDVTVLFENLWWPGLRLTDKAVVKKFFEAIKRKNVGIMLDAGHLMSTERSLRTQKDGIDYIIKTVDALEEYKHLIYGIHLSCSLSGEYQERVIKGEETITEIYRHILKIDQHLPFTDSCVRELIEHVKPRWLVHELTFMDYNDFENNLRMQINACTQGI